MTNLLESGRRADAVVQQRLVHVFDEHHQWPLFNGLVDHLEQCVERRCVRLVHSVTTVLQAQFMGLHIVPMAWLAALFQAAPAIQLVVKADPDQVLCRMIGDTMTNVSKHRAFFVLSSGSTTTRPRKPGQGPLASRASRRPVRQNIPAMPAMDDRLTSEDGPSRWVPMKRTRSPILNVDACLDCRDAPSARAPLPRARRIARVPIWERLAAGKLRHSCADSR